MKRIFSLIFALALASTLRAAETSDVDYGQSASSPSLTLVWQYETKTEGDVTYAVIKGLRDETVAAPSGAITVPTTVYDGANGYVVKAIADNAFKNQIGITSITIPLTVQTIGSGVFTGCTVLSTITVDSANPWFTSADGVLYDKDRTRLVACPATAETVALPSSLKTIGVEAFANCHRLPAITIPAAVTEIGQRAFVGCTLLESLTFKGNAPTADATISDNPEDIVIYKEKSSTGWDAAPWTSFKEIRNTTLDPSSKILTATSGNLTWSYRIVGDGAELYNDGDSVIPAGTSQTFTYDAATKTWVGDGALNIPSELGGYPVTRIGVRAFRNCSALTAVNIPSSVTLVDDYAFEDCGGLTTLSLPTALTELGSEPFTGSWISSIALPAKLKTLRGNPVAGCLNLDTITVDAKNRYFTAVDNVLYSRDQTQLYGIQTFVEKFTVPASVTWVAVDAFSACTLLTSVTYLGNAPDLDDGGAALYADTALTLTTYTAAGTTGWNGSDTSTNMPASGRWPLVGTNTRPIVSLYTPGSSGPGAQSDDGTFTVTIGNVSWTYRITNEVAVIEKGVLSKVSEVSIPDKLKGCPVKSIGCDGRYDSIFDSCADEVLAIQIPDTVTSIADYAFYGCSIIEDMTIPNSVSTIGKHAFSSCSSLKTVSVSTNLTHLGEYAFYNCSRLAGIDLQDCLELKTISDSAFFGCLKLSSVKLPRYVTTIGQDAFEYNYALTGISFPRSLRALQASSFYGCNDLVEVTFQGNLPSGLEISDILSSAALKNVNCCAEDAAELEEIKRQNGYTFRINGRINSGSGAETDSSGVTWGYYIADNKATITNISGKSSTITIPQTLGDASVDSITVDALNKLSGVKTFASKSAAYTARNGVLYTADGKHLVRVPDLMTLPYTVTTNTTTISYTITTVTASGGASISSNVTSKSTKPVTVKVSGDVTAEALLAGVTAIDSYAFLNCNVFTDSTGSSNQAVGSPVTEIEEKGDGFITRVVTTRESVSWTETHETLLELASSVTVAPNATTQSGVTLKQTGKTNYNQGTGSGGTSFVTDDSDSLDATVANVFNGLIADSAGLPLGTIKVTTAKATGKTGQQTCKITATIKMAGETKSVSVRGSVDSTDATGSWTTADGRVLTLAFTRNTMTGTFDGNAIEGVRNVFSLSTKTTLAKAERTAAESVFSTLKQNDTLAFASDDGWNVLTLTFKTKGSVIVSGKLANGTSISLTSQLLVGDTVSCIPVVYASKKASLAFSIYFSNDGSEMEVVGLDEAAIAPVGKLDEGLAFSLDAGIYDLFDDVTILDEFLPEGVSVEQTGKSKWTVANGAKSGTIKIVDGEAVDTKESDNPSGLQLTYAAKTGVFRGTFKIYTLDAKGKLKSVSASVYGVVVDGYGYGTATVSRRGTFAIAITP